MTRPWTQARRRLLYEEAVTLIHRDFAQPLDVGLVARRVTTSRRQLQRVFEEIGSTTVRGYIAETRMRIAARLLHTRPDLSVREVGAAVSYRHPAQFAKAFRRVHGTTPSVYRRMPAAAAAERTLR